MEFISQNIIWILLAAASGLALVIPAIRGGGAKSVSPAQTVMLMNRQHAILVDVRDPAEYEAQRIADAKAIPLGDLASRTEELKKFKSRPVVVVCAAGTRSVKGVEILAKAGFEQVFSLTGGIKAWKEAGLPLKAGATKE